MAVNKPETPEISLPENFGGVKTPFSNSKIRDGFQENIPDLLAGDNLNYLIDRKSVV